jgi:hypothetical protein
MSGMTPITIIARVSKTNGISNTCPCKSATTYEYEGNS